MTLSLELSKIINDFASEESAAVFKCRFIDNYLRSFCLYALHNPLNAALAEVVAIAFHCQAIHSDYTLLFFLRIEIALIIVVVIPGHMQYSVRDEVLPGSVGVHYGLYQVLRNIVVVGQ